ncbi:glycosyltransferase family 2 protein [Phascolarctobacterium faecium]|uniref:glycosyltransferase family 2 protein n=1 Tax=Phascolarctobacterium faecium TaxID=33025 RepID=UPI00300EE21D
MEKLISIIVPVYKVEKYIHKAVNSILEQTYKNLEVILVDDGSPDNCPKICDEYAAKDKRVKVIHQKNMWCSYSTAGGNITISGHIYWFY